MALTYYGGVARIPLGITDLAEPHYLKSNTIIEGKGPGSVLRVTNAVAGLIYRGDVANVQIRNLRITGAEGGNPLANGIRNVTGSNARDFHLFNVWIDNLSLGVSLNAYEAGSFRRAMLVNVHVSDIGGKLPGSGYGFHIAKAYDVSLFGCSATRCGRHSLYLAASEGPSGAVVRGFRIRQHREKEHDGAYRTAVAIARIQGVSLDVDIQDSWDGGIDVAAINNAADGVGQCRDISIRGMFSGRRGEHSYIRIGEELVTDFRPFITESINISGSFTSDGEGPRAADIAIMNGRNINIHGCSFSHREPHVRGVTRTCIAVGDKRFYSEQQHLNMIGIHGNVAQFDGDRAGTRFIETYRDMNVPIQLAESGNLTNAESNLYNAG